MKLGFLIRRINGWKAKTRKREKSFNFKNQRLEFEDLAHMELFLNYILSCLFLLNPRSGSKNCAKITETHLLSSL
jgi:hypothetical protein